MRLLEYRSAITWLKKVLKISESNSYLQVLIDNLEHHRENDSTLPFKLISIKERGFVVKVGGLFGFVSFNYMPWEYPDQENWKAIFPFLTDRMFFCKIHTIERNPIFILINGKIPQFKKPELKQNDLYCGIIIRKTNYGLFIDIGFHFNWEYGSLVGLLHKSNFENNALFERTEAGQSTEVLLLGFNERNQLVYGNKPAMEEWFTGELGNRVGEMVWVKVGKLKDMPPCYKVEGKYDASLSVTGNLYPGRKGRVLKAIRNLTHDEIIRCEIIGLDLQRRVLFIKWTLEWEIDTVAARSDHSKVDKDEDSIGGTPEPHQNLHLIGRPVKVSVLKRKGRFGKMWNSYLVDNKYKGHLYIENDTYHLTKREKEQIEDNLLDGDVLEAEVIRIDPDGVWVKWIIKES